MDTQRAPACKALTGKPRHFQQPGGAGPPPGVRSSLVPNTFSEVCESDIGDRIDSFGIQHSEVVTVDDIGLNDLEWNSIGFPQPIDINLVGDKLVDSLPGQALGQTTI